MSEIFRLKVQTGYYELTNKIQENLTKEFGNHSKMHFRNENKLLAIEVSHSITTAEFFAFISYFLNLKIVEQNNLRFQNSVVPKKLKAIVQEFHLNLSWEEPSKLS